MDIKIIIVGIIVVIAVIAAVYLVVLTPSQGGEGGGATPQPSGSTQTQPPPGSGTSGTTNATQPTTTTQPMEKKQHNLTISAEIHVKNASQEDKENGIEYYVTIFVKIKNNIKDKIYVVAIYPDDIKLTSSSPLVEQAFILFNPPVEVKPNKYIKYNYTINIPTELAEQWANGTQHTINVVYRIGSATGKKHVESVEVIAVSKD